jgi:FlaG/FlaF family flagellin (archaellin)
MAAALPFARERAGSNILARIAMIAITTSSSMSVKATRNPCRPLEE